MGGVRVAYDLEEGVYEANAQEVGVQTRDDEGNFIANGTDEFGNTYAMIMKQWNYYKAETPMEPSVAEKRKIATLARRKRELAEREAALDKKREVPSDPFSRKKSVATPAPSVTEASPKQAMPTPSGNGIRKPQGATPFAKR